jgi:DNA invertase Pin-like site-specific DNA recombinase
MLHTALKLAICYGRFSTQEQAKGYSLERQKTLATEYATSQGWTVEKSIFDEGKSAFHGGNREEGAALFEFEAEARQGIHRGKVLVVENIDRLSRQGARAAAQLIWSLNEAGVDVATYQDRQLYRAENTDMMEVFRLIIIAQQAHEESKNKSNRTKATWAKRIKAIESGKAIPIPHYPKWIDFVDGQYVLNEHRVRVLNEVFDLYISGKGISSIAVHLNKRSEPVWTEVGNHVGNGWFYSYIWRLLTNRAVLGEYLTADGKLLSASFYPQAISSEKWNRAQAALNLRKSNVKVERSRNRNLLKGMVFCGCCGGGVRYEHGTKSTKHYTRKDGSVHVYPVRRNPYLRCDRARREHNCDNDINLLYHTVEATILEGMLPLLIDRETASAKSVELQGQVAEAARLVDAAQVRLNNVVEAIENGAGLAFIERSKALEAEILQHKERQAHLEAALAIEESKPSTRDDTALIAELKAEITHEDDERREPARARVNYALRRLIKRIDLETGGYRIWLSDDEWYLFDTKGVMLESQQVWKAA